MSANNMLITTIKPTMGAFVEFQPRTKEGEEKRPEVFASYEMPVIISSINDAELKRFVKSAYESELILAMRTALKDGKPEFAQPSINECYVSTGKREFTVTKEKVLEWFDTFTRHFLEKAICLKSGLEASHHKVGKKMLEYRELLTLVSARSIISQIEIDKILKVMELVESQETKNAYTDNVLQGIARQQEKLDDFLKVGEDDSDSGIDF